MTVVQDPNDAAYPEMPLTALNRVKPDHVVRLKDMPGLLTNLVHEPAGEAKTLPRSVQFEVEIARTGRSAIFEREMDIVRNSTRRMDRLAAQVDMAKQSAAE